MNIKNVHFFKFIKGIPMLIKLKKVIEITTLSKSTIYRKINNGTFPKQIKISDRCSAWNQADIENWIDNCLTESK